ncbi:hypothetical protein RHSIM_Rhsim13G0110700 [Rhododendron simsii]|uniref:LYR motif containing domain-containing protein n=1 Tax=Rhododendron simsii TaxID=118357 RepID=A0A834FZL1_RHOSS|nr:hypothetical protein RHSIM_Rhsim13G0110700 [Rhododendron simsii]
MECFSREDTDIGSVIAVDDDDDPLLRSILVLSLVVLMFLPNYLFDIPGPLLESRLLKILEKFPSLNLVQDCNSIVEDELEKESSRLETKYYADLQHDQFDNEDSDYMNESHTFGNYDFKSCLFMALSAPFVKVLGKEKDDHFNTNGRVYAIVIGNGNPEDMHDSSLCPLAQLAKKAEVRAIFILASEELSLHNIQDLFDAADYSLSLLRKGEIPKYIQ